jgi:glutathione S-transferase
MQIYGSFGPNPRALRWFLLEKGIEIPTRELDILGGENRKSPYVDKNPGGQLPALELDDGRVIGETVAIFEYIEEKHPTPPLVGKTAEDRAETRMWQRRIELNITEPLYAAFRFSDGVEMFKTRIHVIPQAAADLKAVVQERLGWLDKLIAGRDWIVPGRFTIADIILYAALDFGATAGQPLNPGLANINGWFKRVGARPGATASLHPAAAQVKMAG